MRHRRPHPFVPRRLQLAVHVNLRVGLVAHEDDAQAGLTAGPTRKRRRPRRQLGSDLAGNGGAVEDARRHVNAHLIAGRRDLHDSARRYSFTRASGLPVDSRSEMTATAAAPARITSGARSRVIPPIATIGFVQPACSKNPRGLAHERHADVAVSRFLRRRAEDRPHRNIVDCQRRRLRAPDPASALTRQLWLLRREFCGPMRDRDRPVPRARRRPRTTSRCRRDRSR